MILPIMNTLFDDKNSYVFQPVYDFPMHGLSFSDIDASQMLSYVIRNCSGRISRCRKCSSCSPAVRS